jgi:glycosyltransferase involved in cell wall biosynthesis
VIAIDVTPLALEPRRGVATALRALLEGFRRAPPGEPVRLFAPRALAPTEPTLDGVVVAVPPVASARAFRRRLPRLLSREGADVLYSPWSAFPRVEVPVVCLVHELPFVRLGPVEGRFRTWRHRRWLARDLAECAAVIVPSTATREDVLRVGPGAEARVHRIPHGFDPGPWVSRRAPPAAPPRVVMLGTGGGRAGAWKKGLDVFDAARPALVAAGLRADAVDGVEDRAAKDALAGARVLAYPSRSEGFGFPPLEAMAAGVPVVASDLPAVREVAGDAALLVTPGDAAALAAAVVAAHEDEGLRARLVARGRERARAFPPEKTAREVAAVLRGARGLA